MTFRVNYQPGTACPGGHREHKVTDLRGPAVVDAMASAMLPANDASMVEPYFVKAPSGVTPFDNGSTDYRYICYGRLAGTGVRVSYSNTIDASWTNEEAVTGLTGTPAGPAFTFDLAEVRSGGAKNATKYLFYCNTGVATTSTARLRYALVDKDNNKTCSGDTALDLTNVLAASGWNKNLYSVHYAKVDSFFTQLADGAVQDNKVFLIGVFGDDTSHYLGAIYGKSLSDLKSKQITVATAWNDNIGLGRCALTILTGDYGMPQPIRGIGFVGVASNVPATLSTPTSCSLVASRGSMSGWFECGNAFLNLTAPGASTKVWARAFSDRTDQDTARYSLLVEGDDTAASARWFHFSDFGVGANDTRPTAILI